jgi:hypothetical protein
VEHHRPLAPVRVSVAVVQSKDGPRTANRPRHLLVRVLARGEAQKSVHNLASTNPQPRRPAVQVPAKHEVEKREAKVPLANLARRQEQECQLGLSPDRENRSAARKKARKKHRRQDHNIGVRNCGSGENPGPVFSIPPVFL